MLYVDASAYLKRYLDESESDACVRLMATEPIWTTAGITLVEVRRNLTIALQGPARDQARRDFAADWSRTAVIDVDRSTVHRAAEIAEVTGCRSQDALHLASADRIRSASPTMLTYDRRQAAGAALLGLAVAAPTT